MFFSLWTRLRLRTSNCRRRGSRLCVEDSLERQSIIRQALLVGGYGSGTSQLVVLQFLHSVSPSRRTQIMKSGEQVGLTLVPTIRLRLRVTLRLLVFHYRQSGHLHLKPPVLILNDDIRTVIMRAFGHRMCGLRC